MPKAADRLQRQHQHISRLLTVVERQLGALARGRAPDYQLMRDVFEYLADYPDRYHHPYEDFVFARLVKQRPEETERVRSLADQHALLVAYGRQVQGPLTDLLHGSVIPRSELLALGRAYVDEYRDHLRHELEALAAATRHLTPADWIQIDTAFYWQPDPLFGQHVEARYQLLADRIAIEFDKRIRNDAGEEICSVCGA